MITILYCCAAFVQRHPPPMFCFKFISNLDGVNNIQMCKDGHGNEFRLVTVIVVDLQFLKFYKV